MFIIGHKNPDTDAIVCALIAQEMFEQMGIESQAIRIGELNKETEYVLNKFGIEAPEFKTELEDGSIVCLVDHNELSQAIDNLEKYHLEWIIDHHKFNLQTVSPLNIRAEGLASTASVLYKMYVENDLQITKDIACLMLAGIVSDTLYFRSPTTTDIDKQIAYELNKIAKIDDLEKFSVEMFDAKSDLSEFSAEEIVEMDYKTYQINENKISIGVIETTNPKFSLDKSEEIKAVLSKLKEENNLLASFIFVVDIINEESIGICISDKEESILRGAFKQTKDLGEGLISIGNVLSRKKEMVPAIETYLTQ